MTNWRESETRLVLAAVQRFRAFIPNICILVYATSPWKLLAPLSILQCTRTFSFVRAPTIISTQFSLALFSFLSFFLFSPMLYLNTENYILPDPAQNVKRNSFCNREREFIFIKFSVEIFSLSNIRSSNRSRDCSSTTSILYHEMYFFSSPGHLHPFPPCTVCFYFLARINIARSRTFTIPSLSVLFTFIFRFFLDFCFLSFSFFLQADGTHFSSSTFDFSFFFFNRSPPLLLPPLLPFPHSCRWKLRGRRNIKYAVYPCLKSYIYIYTLSYDTISLQCPIFSRLFFYLFDILFLLFSLFVFCFFTQLQLMAIELLSETREGDDGDNIIAAYWNPCSTVICPFHFDYDR